MAHITEVAKDSKKEGKEQKKNAVDPKKEVKDPKNEPADPKKNAETENAKKDEIKTEEPKAGGVECLMETIIKKHGLPICNIEKNVVEPYQPPPKTWWHRPSCIYAFVHPKIRSRLERLMGSNLVRLTDRKYMLKLHDRILEDYIQSMNKRIAEREARERDREKSLILTGKIPLDQAPKNLSNHPILLINDYCEKLIAERRAKIKVPKVVIPLYLYLDDTPDPLAGLSIKEGHMFRSIDDPLCVPPSDHLAFKDEEDVKRGYMFSAKEYEKKQKYENPEVKELLQASSVEQMYILADQIIGPLKTIKKEETEEGV